MPEKTPVSDRDKTLINILERMVGQIQRQDILLNEIIKNQNEFTKSAGSLEYRRSALQREADDSLGKIQDSINRYRSDMLSLVNEQDNTSKSLKELNKMVSKSSYTLESSAQTLSGLDERTISQEKVVSKHYEHALKQAEIIPKEIADASRSLSKLHADTEKRLVEQHRDTVRLLEQLQHETTRRLLVLDSFDEALRTLLIRTEPPEKKPFFLVRLFSRISLFFRFKLPKLFKGKQPPPD